jgi:hypothetical protein
MERAAGPFSAAALARLLGAASLCDGVIKGLRRPDWPHDPWQALRRLAWMTHARGRPAARAARLRLPGRSRARFLNSRAGGPPGWASGRPAARRARLSATTAAALRRSVSCGHVGQHA